MLRKINSNGRAPALHAGSTGIDTRILQEQDFCNNGNNFLVFSFLYFSFPHFSAQKTRVVCQDFLHKITELQLLCIILELQQRFLWFTLYFKQPRRAKMTTLNCRSLILYESNWQPLK